MHSPGEFAITGMGLRRLRQERVGADKPADDMQNVEYKAELRAFELARRLAAGRGTRRVHRGGDAAERVLPRLADLVEGALDLRLALDAEADRDLRGAHSESRA